MDSDVAARQLRLIGRIGDVAAEAGVEMWLRGGWAMDFFLGAVTRPHLDIDFFCWAADIDRLMPGLHRLGLSDVPGPPAGLQRDLVSADQLDVSVTLLARAPDGSPVVPAGPHAGARWPANLLEREPRRLGEVTFRIVSPQAQIEVKEMMPVWVPGLPRRDKDREDINRLKAALTD